MSEKASDLINGIKSLGISAAAVFPAGEIKFDDVFREMCRQNVCGRYGKNYKCPPHIGEPADLKTAYSLRILRKLQNI